MLIREVVSVHAHESQYKYSALSGKLDLDKPILHTWKNIFLVDKLGPIRDLKDRMIAIRYIFERDLVVSSFTLSSFLHCRH